MEFPSCVFDAGVQDENQYDENEYSEVDWSKALKRLFAPPATVARNDCLESDYADYVEILFAAPVPEDRKICLEYDYANALKRLFAPPAGLARNDCLESDYADYLQILFAVPVARDGNICLEYDYGEDLKHLFAAVKPYYQIDFEVLQAGLAQFAGVPDDDNNYDAEDVFPDYDFEESIPFCRIRAKKGAKKSRRDGRVRSKRLERKILKGGVYEGMPIMNGSFGPCGFEM